MAFAEALASGGSSQPSGREAATGELPQWARRLSPEPDELAGTVLAVGSEASIISVANRFKTWEPFYVSLHPADAPWEIEPAQGTLAPRGGANNACDPSKPYSDTQRFVVRCRGGEAAAEALLVVGTEEEKWTFALRVMSSDETRALQ